MCLTRPVSVSRCAKALRVESAKTLRGQHHIRLRHDLPGMTGHLLMQGVQRIPNRLRGIRLEDSTSLVKSPRRPHLIGC